MGAFRRVRAAVLIAFFVIVAVGAGACSRNAAAPGSSPQAVFDAAVAKADAAWASGDAEKAFDLYTAALKTKGATDSGGKVAAQQEKAKRLMLSRSILAKTEPSLGSLSAYVQVLQYSAAESTEAAAARSGLVDSLKSYPGQMRAEIAKMRKDINADRSVEMPFVVTLVSKMADGWVTEVGQAPGPVGVHAAAAAKAMGTATKAVDKAFARKFAEDALSDLAAADKSLATADRELAAARTGTR